MDNRFFQSETRFLVTESNLADAKAVPLHEHTRAYRQRLRAAGSEEVLLQFRARRWRCSTRSRNARGCGIAARRYCN